MKDKKLLEKIKKNFYGKDARRIIGNI